MNFGEQEIVQIVESVWTSVLDWPVRRAASVSSPLSAGEYLTGCVPITGAWTGAVLLHCPADLVKAAASGIFGLPSAVVVLELMQDALGELTNIIGGNVKALFGGGCFLGLPVVAGGHDYALRVASSRTLLLVAFQSGEWPFSVEVCEGDAPLAGGEPGA